MLIKNVVKRSQKKRLIKANLNGSFNQQNSPSYTYWQLLILYNKLKEIEIVYLK